MGESMLLKAILEFDSANAIASMGRASVSFQRMRANTQRLKGGMDKVGGAMGKLTLGFAPLAIGMGLAVHHAHQFERGVAEVTTIADEAEFPLSKIEGLTLDLAKTYGTAPVDQTKALYQAISAGATDAATATDLLHTANKLAIGGVTDTFVATDVLTTALNAYEAQGLKAADASDAMFTAMRAGKTTIGELGSYLGNVIPVASQLGVEFHELNAAVAAITLQGLNTAEATTGLNAALANVIKPSKDAQEAAEQLGIDFSSTALKAKGLSGFMGEIVDKAGGDEVAMSKLFGSIRGVKAIMALTNNEASAFNDILAQMEERTGATDKAFQKMAGTSDFQMRRLNALRVVASTVFGQVLERSLVRMLSPLAGVGEGFVAILEAVKTGEFQGLGETARAIAEGIRDGFDLVTESVDWVVAKFRQAGSWVEKTFGADTLRTVSKMATVFGVAAAALVPIAAVLGGIGFVLPAIFSLLTGIGTVLAGAFGLLTGPIGLVIAAVILFRDELWAIAQGVTAALMPVFQELWHNIQFVFRDVMDWFRALGLMYQDTTGGMMDGFKAVGKVIGTVLGAALSFVVKTLLIVFKIGAGVTGLLIAGFVNLGKWLGKFAGWVTELVMNPLRTVTRAAIGLMDLVGMGDKVPADVRAGSTAAPRAAGRGLGAGVLTDAERMGRQEARGMAEEKVAAEQERGALAGILDEVAAAANGAAGSAAAAADAAKKKPCAQVNVDGRELARSNAKATGEIKARSGEAVTPWQRQQIAVHGAVPAV
jgi:TP901 family phage tail tape measure protein